MAQVVEILPHGRQGHVRLTELKPWLLDNFTRAFAAMLSSLSPREVIFLLQWRHNELDGVYNHQRLDCLLNRLFNPPVTGGFPSQRASNTESVCIWLRQHQFVYVYVLQLGAKPLTFAKYFISKGTLGCRVIGNENIGFPPIFEATFDPVWLMMII